MSIRSANAFPGRLVLVFINGQMSMRQAHFQPFKMYCCNLFAWLYCDAHAPFYFAHMSHEERIIISEQLTKNSLLCPLMNHFLWLLFHFVAFFPCVCYPKTTSRFACISVDEFSGIMVTSVHHDSDQLWSFELYQWNMPSMSMSKWVASPAWQHQPVCMSRRLVYVFAETHSG